jgi:hypothetical protein
MEPSARGGQTGDGSQTAAAGKEGVDLRAQTPGAVASTDIRPKDHLVSDAIGKALQAHYRDLAEAPLPDRLRVLLAQLEATGSQDD